MRAVSRQLAILSDNGDPERGGSRERKSPRHARRDTLPWRMLAYVQRQPPWAIFGTGFSIALLVGSLDYFYGESLILTPLYLLPLVVAAWGLRLRWAIALAAGYTLTWSVARALSVPLSLETIPTYWNIGAQFCLFVGASTAVSWLRDALGEQQELARTDAATGAANSRAFFERLDLELVRSRRYGHAFTVAYLDADNFKAINDRFGHEAGDALLRTVVSTVQENIRAADFLARIAGDEFTLLLPETGQKESEMVLARVRKALAAAMQSGDWPVTFSIGVVTFAAPPPTVEALVRIADELMYSVKRHGKNSVEHAVYDERKGAA